jgi:hypothetical protein
MNVMNMVGILPGLTLVLIIIIANLAIDWYHNNL